MKIFINSFKIFIPIILITITLVLGITAIINKSNRAIIYNSEKNIVNVNFEGIHKDMSNLISDLRFLASSSDVHNYLKDPEDKKVLNDFKSELLSFSNIRRVYDQIRFIDTTGMEIIRINFNNGNPEIVSQDELQNKKDRYYFLEAMQLGNSQIYISPFDLNIENGKIEIPLKPMIRLAIPVFDSNYVKRGIFVLNFLGENILNNQINIKDNLVNNVYMLLNS